MDGAEDIGQIIAILPTHQYAMVSVSNLGTNKKEFVLYIDGP